MLELHNIIPYYTAVVFLKVTPPILLCFQSTVQVCLQVLGTSTADSMLFIILEVYVLKSQPKKRTNKLIRHHFFNFFLLADEDKHNSPDSQL